MARDYYDDVEKFAQSLNHDGDDWERMILDGCPRPLLHEDLEELVVWWYNDASSETDIAVAEILTVAEGLAAIADGSEG